MENKKIFIMLYLRAVSAVRYRSLDLEQVCHTDTHFAWQKVTPIKDQFSARQQIMTIFSEDN
jgi:hypothetical protein